MPQSIPSGLTQGHVLRTLADLDAGTAHPFGQPTGYELVHQGRRYAPKAVVGLACRYSVGRILQPEEFSGGEAPGQANFVLRKLGFAVARKGEDAGEDEKAPHKDWSEQEVRLIVSDYFAMLEAELLGKPFRKSDHRKALAPKLQGRSDGSIEFKHQNVSGVLVELGLPYIGGYKPRGNYQGILATEVEGFLDQHPGFLDQLASAPVVNPRRANESPLPTSTGSSKTRRRRPSHPPPRASRGCPVRPGRSTSPSGTPPTVISAGSASSSCSTWSGVA